MATLAGLTALVGPLVSCGDEGTGPDQAVDDIPPFVVSSSPANDEQSVSIHTRVTVVFSEPLDSASVGAEAVTLSSEGGPVVGVVSQRDPTSVTFTPDGPLDFATAYNATVAATVSDTAGNTLVAAVSFAFWTAELGLPQLNESSILGDIAALAADSMFGRRTGSEHEQRAAEYIRERFEELGLAPGVSGYLQGFDIPFPVDGVSGLVSRNVLGVLPGAGSLAGQWILVGAHFDHVGFVDVGPDSVVVYNGADDNASGTALLLDVARALSEHVAGGAMPSADRRSVMFQAYGAEEIGLIGSFYYCEHPTVSMDSVVAMINLDMVGRLRNDQVALIGTSSSSDWQALLSGANVHSLDLQYSENLINRSDQACFYQLGKPVAFFHTGLHQEYHTPYDDVETINAPGIVKVGDLVVGTLVEIAVRPDPLASRPVERPQLVLPVGFNHLGEAQTP